ncbi:putative membrane protein [Dokdonella fugitiva]|uniref:Putative membrane protein n=1 Tax=Dokdonella fugitiva TaxID=328517 RepID=A0A839F3X1_9GAMM|nr:sensor domain-containing protein [Dokdonella fugitiva]MBA8886901.1 putative membrane protein [Dokdonella fugitiva]
MSTPRTIREYLDQLRAALGGADPALIQDALYDAEDHLRAELAENPGKSEADVLAKIANSYGAPEEVAAIYVDKEQVVQQALRPPPPPPRRSAIGRFFGVAGDPRAYAALFYMLLSLATGIFYFTWAVTGLSLSLGLSILIFGIAFAVLFFGTVRVLALVEGRIIEVMLGERMPRRPPYTDRELSWRARITAMFTDPRTWSTLLYMVLMLPLGILYFTLAVVGITLSIGMIAGPFALVLAQFGVIEGGIYLDGQSVVPPLVIMPLALLLGIVLPFAVLHLARGVGHLQGALAKHLLVKSASG